MEAVKRFGKRYLPPKIKQWLKGMIIRYNIDFGAKSAQTQQAIKLQDQYDLEALRAARKIVVFLVPNDGEISGGLLSIFHFVDFTRELLDDGYCIISTVPGRYTYAQNLTFKNSEQIFRWEQIASNCSQCQELVVHIPEYFAEFFYGSLSRNDIEFLRGVPKFRINILNQNIDYMPKPDKLMTLRYLTDCVSQSAGFERYATQEVCNTFKMPLYYIPSYINLEHCIVKEFTEKKKLILFSNDQNLDKRQILSKLQDEFYDYEIREIQGFSYEEYLELMSEAQFCISFGEGFDGYYIQPYYANGIGISVYNDRFFPNPAIQDFPFVYASFDVMFERVYDDIRSVKDQQDKYEAVVNRVYSYLTENINHSGKTAAGLEKYYENTADYYPKDNQ
ncbi:hypothetical protein [uncultured Pseudodesulfovibrio sp.]|uniref:hypothetical protein n=1 Tax=uncultured Pseudodesulfovibrio sp. TaxID=2035858 RepID=UPI0029C91FE1|nr:hypothetical protein [uncultured Pseudodesulfovibrio sp.]